MPMHLKDFQFGSKKNIRELASELAANAGSEAWSALLADHIANMSYDEFVEMAKNQVPFSLNWLIRMAIKNEGRGLSTTVGVAEALLDSALPDIAAAGAEGTLEGTYTGLTRFIDRHAGTGDRDVFKEKLVADIFDELVLVGTEPNKVPAPECGIGEDGLLHFLHNRACGVKYVEGDPCGTLDQMGKAHPHVKTCDACFNEHRDEAGRIVIVPPAKVPVKDDYVKLLGKTRYAKAFALVRVIGRLRDDDWVNDPTNWYHISSGMLEAIRRKADILKLMPEIDVTKDKKVRNAVEQVILLCNKAKAERARRRRLSGTKRPGAKEAERLIREGEAALDDDDKEKLAKNVKIVRACFDSYENFFAAVQLESNPAGLTALVADLRNTLNNLATNEGREGVRDWLDSMRDHITGFVDNDLKDWYKWVLSDVLGNFLWVTIMCAVIGAALTVFGFLGAIAPVQAAWVLWTTYFLLALTIVGVSALSRLVRELVNGWREHKWWMIPRAIYSIVRRWGLTAATLLVVGTFSPLIGYLAFGPGHPMWFGLGFIGWVFVLIFSMLARVPDDLINAPLNLARNLGNRNKIGAFDRLSLMMAKAMSRRYGFPVPGDANNDGVPDNMQKPERKPVQIGRNIGTIFSLIASFLLVFTSGIGELGIWYQFWNACSTDTVLTHKILGYFTYYEYGAYALFFAGLGNMILWNLGIWALTAEFRARSRYTMVRDPALEANLLDRERGKEVLTVWWATRTASWVVLLLVSLLVVLPVQFGIIGVGHLQYAATHKEARSDLKATEDGWKELVGITPPAELIAAKRAEAEARRQELKDRKNNLPSKSQPDNDADAVRARLKKRLAQLNP